MSKIVMLADGPDFLKPIEDAKVRAMVHASEERARKLHAITKEVQARNVDTNYRLEQIRQKARELGIKCGPVPRLLKTGTK